MLAASPDCAPALRYLLVERSEVLRSAQREVLALEPAEDAIGPMMQDVDGDDEAVPVAGSGPIVAALGELPVVGLTGVVLANELLDNLPFRVVERADDGWLEVRVGVAPDSDQLVELLVPASSDLTVEADLVAAGAVPPGAGSPGAGSPGAGSPGAGSPGTGSPGPVSPSRVPTGTRLPVPSAARAWMHDCARSISRGYLVIVDYAGTARDLVDRGSDGWLRTYREHSRGGRPLAAPGEQDITYDLPLEYIIHVAGRAGWDLVLSTNQADWLRSLGMDDLVATARAEWDARAHIGDLEALRHRSRVTEAAALTDPSGLGDHRVLLFTRRTQPTT